MCSAKASCLTGQGALFRPKRREGDLYKLAKALYFGQEGEKATCTNSPRRFNEKARRRLVQTRQGAFFKTRRREGDLYKLAKAPCLIREGDLYKLAKAPCFSQEGEKATCTNSARCLILAKNAKRRLIQTRQGVLFRLRR